MAEPPSPLARRRTFAGKVERRLRDPILVKRALPPPTSRHQRIPITDFDDVRRRNRYPNREAEDEEEKFHVQPERRGTGAPTSSNKVVDPLPETITEQNSSISEDYAVFETRRSAAEQYTQFRAIAMLTMVFLPATFVATVLAVL